MAMAMAVAMAASSFGVVFGMVDSLIFVFYETIVMWVVIT
jgi:hypothetical protein